MNASIYQSTQPALLNFPFNDEVLQKTQSWDELTTLKALQFLAIFASQTFFNEYRGFENVLSSMKVRPSQRLDRSEVSSVTRFGDLLDFGQLPWAAINMPKSPTFLGNLCKCVKIYHFSSKIIFGQFLEIFDNFFLVTLEVSKFTYFFCSLAFNGKKDIFPLFPSTAHK